MTRDITDLANLQCALRAFRDDRSWEKFHTPKNLAMALSAEVGELLELFQWLTPEESKTFGPQLPRARVEEELADVFIYLLNMADVLDIDLLLAATGKIEQNAQKYPTAKV